LASQSPQRKLILDTLHIPFKVMPADVDEQAIVNDDPRKRAELVARAKAEEIQINNPNSIVIAADTFTQIDGRSFEKPESKREAKEMLMAQSGKEGQALTGFCYLDSEKELNFSTVVVTDFKFRPLSQREIAHYISNEPVTTWSAAFCPGYPSGMALVEWIKGSMTGFTHGLPIELVAKLLKESGVKI